MPGLTPQPISISSELAEVRFLPDRTPATTPEESADSFSLLSTYRDGGIFVGHWAGTSEWERHPAGDEIVLVVDGHTTISFLVDRTEQTAPLRPGHLVVVPQGVWHRFETPEQVQLLSVTPQPSEYRSDQPD